MGYSYDQVSGPVMCFNGQKHYATRWYQSRTRHLFEDDLPFAGWLAFFGEATKTAPNEPVIWALILPGPERLFLQYNKAQSINVGTQSSRNAVTVTRDDGHVLETSGLQSWSVAG